MVGLQKPRVVTVMFRLNLRRLGGGVERLAICRRLHRFHVESMINPTPVPAAAHRPGPYQSHGMNTECRRGRRRRRLRVHTDLCSMATELVSAAGDKLTFPNGRPLPWGPCKHHGRHVESDATPDAGS